MVNIDDPIGEYKANLLEALEGFRKARQEKIRVDENMINNTTSPSTLDERRANVFYLEAQIHILDDIIEILKD